MKYNYRYIARIVIQAETPIAVGSGNKELSTDRPVAKDANGIPFIPGTSLAGVLRHAIYANAGSVENGDKIIPSLNDDIFGFQHPDKQENSLGSRLALSSAHLIGKKVKEHDALGNITESNKVFDGLCIIPEDDINFDFINLFRHLPVREHVRISHKGSADTINKGKFDEEVLYKGSRFIFEIELKGTDKTSNVDEEKWNQILNIFRHPDFRIGGGSNRGFGKIRIENIKQKILCLGDENQRNFYLKHSACLDSNFEGEDLKICEAEKTKCTRYILNLEPEDFYLFSSGLRSDEAKINPVTEQIIVWDNLDNPTFSKEQVLILIPASSVKGAISHRVAYHYIKLDNFNREEKDKIYADRLPEGKTIKDFTGENNIAVKALFGEASDYSDLKKGQKGAVLFSDVYRETVNYKKLDHVAIDRFTGGAIDGALFNENVVRDIVNKENEFILEFLVKPEFIKKHKTGEKGLEEKDHILKAFEKTLIDICSGSLPLGGGTMRGNGVFNGTLKSNKNGKDETLYSKE